MTSLASSNYFELFGLSTSFDVDLSFLGERYRQLQQAAHPDRFASGSDQERRLAVQQTALINEAYDTLKNPLSRAKYLLQINGIDLGSDTDTRMDGAFLMEQMELREALGEARAGKDVDALEGINARIEKLYRQLLDGLAQNFRQTDDASLVAARDNVRKLQFIQRLAAELAALEDELI